MSASGRFHYQDDSELPTGRFPDNIYFNGGKDILRLSVDSNPTIDALAHVHVVNFDIDTSPPYSMNIQLPIMASLPNQGRLYFFYVSYCHDLDVLSFTPFAGSGDTVNGNLGTFSFTQTGFKQLYIVVGVAGNYIIHSFGGGGGGPIPPVSNTLPTEYWEFHGEVPPITGPSFGYQAMPSAASDLYNGVGAPLGPTTVIPGMAGFLTADVPVPTQPFRGFLCNESGMYLVDPQFEARLV